MSQRYPRFRHAQRVGGPYRSGRRSASLSGLDILGIAAVFGIVTFLAIPMPQAPSRTATPPPLQVAATEASVYYAGCNEARAAGAAPIHRGSPGYRPDMDGDDDGIACEPHR